MFQSSNHEPIYTFNGNTIRSLSKAEMNCGRS